MSRAEDSPILEFLEAVKVVREHASGVRFQSSRKPETVALSEALGRVLARPILADRDLPPFDRSTRDGYACHSADLAGGAPISVIGEVRAGDIVETPEAPLHRGSAIEIMTGAPVPAGADCVVMFEHLVFDEDAKTIHLRAERLLQPGENIVRAGAEARRGDIVLHSGTRLKPSHIAAAAACGATQLPVQQPPRVAILASGDELVDVETIPQPHQIRNSNSYSIAAQVASAGALPMRRPIVRDDPGILQSAIRAALDADLLLLSGGASVGKYDFTAEALLALGAEFYFTGALIQPGKPVIFGRLPHAVGPKYFFALPGNPVSTLVTFHLFVRPLLSALGGEDSTTPRFAQARLTADVHVKTGLTRFLPALLSGDLEPSVEPVEWQGSGDLAGNATANCYLVIPPDRDSLPAGETVTLLLS